MPTISGQSLGQLVDWRGEWKSQDDLLLSRRSTAIRGPRWANGGSRRHFAFRSGHRKGPKRDHWASGARVDDVLQLLKPKRDMVERNVIDMFVKAPAFTCELGAQSCR